jgi:hypothetical protein
MQLGLKNPNKTSWDNTNMQPIEKIINKTFSPEGPGLTRKWSNRIGRLLNRTHMHNQARQFVSWSHQIWSYGRYGLLAPFSSGWRKKPRRQA